MKENLLRNNHGQSLDKPTFCFYLYHTSDCGLENLTDNVKLVQIWWPELLTQTLTGITFSLTNMCIMCDTPHLEEFYTLRLTSYLVPAYGLTGVFCVAVYMQLQATTSMQVYE